MVMKTKYVLVLMAMMFVISGCREEVTKEVGDTTINIAELNGKREIDKNDKIFANNNQGKHDLLMLMANSVDHYNLISGTMLSVCRRERARRRCDRRRPRHDPSHSGRNDRSLCGPHRVHDHLPGMHHGEIVRVRGEERKRKSLPVREGRLQQKKRDP